jgi:hypothetical protein
MEKHTLTMEDIKQSSRPIIPNKSARKKIMKGWERPEYYSVTYYESIKQIIAYKAMNKKIWVVQVSFDNNNIYINTDGEEEAKKIASRIYKCVNTGENVIDIDEIRRE